MASQTLVIGSAVHAVAELISSNLNGLLFKQTPGKSMAPGVSQRLGQALFGREGSPLVERSAEVDPPPIGGSAPADRALRAKLTETARGHAYEVFGLRRCVDQHVRLYENVIRGVSPGEGITDSAVVA